MPRSCCALTLYYCLPLALLFIFLMFASSCARARATSAETSPKRPASTRYLSTAGELDEPRERKVKIWPVDNLGIPSFKISIFELPVSLGTYVSTMVFPRGGGGEGSH